MKTALTSQMRSEILSQVASWPLDEALKFCGLPKNAAEQCGVKRQIVSQVIRGELHAPKVEQALRDRIIKFHEDFLLSPSYLEICVAAHRRSIIEPKAGWTDPEMMAALHSPKFLRALRKRDKWARIVEGFKARSERAAEASAK